MIVCLILCSFLVLLSAEILLQLAGGQGQLWLAPACWLLPQLASLTQEALVRAIWQTTADCMRPSLPTILRVTAGHATGRALHGPSIAQPATGMPLYSRLCCTHFS